MTGTRYFKDARTLGLYTAFDGEVDCSRVLDSARASGKSCFLPVLEADALAFREAAAATTLNRFGIPEPGPGSARIEVTGLDLILVPLVAFDRHGNRMGMGKGFYDRALAGVRTAHRPVRIGVAWACQEVDEVRPQEHDVPLHGVITETGWRVTP